MVRRWIMATMVIVCLLQQGSFSRWFNWFLNNDTIITDTIDDVRGSKIEDADDPLRDGSYAVGEGVEDIYNDEQTDTQWSWDKTLRYIKGPVNYFLGIVGLVALIYLIYHGILTLTSGSDENQQKKGLEGVKYAVIAIAWLGVARFILSLIFWLINLVTNAA